MDTISHAHDRRIEQAKASIVARMEELGRRMRELKQKADIPAHIAAHPWIATGGAFAVGLVLGYIAGGRRVVHGDQVAKKSAIAAAFAALVTGAIKELVMHQVKDYAKTWIDGRATGSGTDSFVEH